MKEKLTKKILQVNHMHEEKHKIYFKWMTPNYGHAEFQLCPVIKRGLITEVYIYPLQQPDSKHYYEVKGGFEGMNLGNLLVKEKGENKLSFPNVWHTHYCKEHKCHSMRLYVPREAKCFYVTNNLGLFNLNWE